MIRSQTNLITATVVLSALLFPLVLPLSTFAQGESASDEANQNIIDRVKKTAVKGVTNDNKRGYIATVKRVSEETLAVESKRGIHIIPLENNVVVVQDNKAFKISEIEVDNQVVIIGYQTGDDFEPKRILVLKQPLQTQKKNIVRGKIKSVAKNSLTVITAAEEKIYSFSTKTPFTDIKNEVLKTTDLEEDADILIIAGEEDPNTSVKNSAGKILQARLLSTDSSQETDQEAEPTPTSSSRSTTPRPTTTSIPKTTTTP